ncbi:TPA: hypothetical protein ACGO2A_000903 [Streptococcus suis]|uniref:hypothetical protein n=1 Tax=Streptococcus suis TaxID=1307 RepID=UPI000CF5D245|nr:hypothetical protein [Streptococcus suis]MBY4955552.1 hypothetical protein [Streptococcus suis]MBY4970282.1 hypothetical protein [Streptococcus suis]MBY5016759.1 hypothetical protein [Streptococcus suis]NQJ69940.1 hypothetical protein [Streptococcus suis]NQJ73309.1 hypothetical protein [Streptococcus suis]
MKYIEDNFLDISLYKKSLNSYLEWVFPRKNELESALQQIVSERGFGIFLEPSLYDELIAAGVDEITASSMILLSKVDGYKEILSGNEIHQVDIDRFVRNAVEMSGLRRSTILQLLAAILASHQVKNFDADLSYYDFRKDELESQVAYVIPYSCYEKELQSISTISDAETASEETIRRLNELSSMGLPKAKAYLGWIAEHKFEDMELARAQYLEAAEMGDSFALARLGDLHFKSGPLQDLQKSHEYYTSYGSMELSDQSLENLLEIRKQEANNRKLLLMTLFMAVLIGLTIVYVPIREYATANHFFQYFSIVLLILCSAGFILYFKKRPYCNLQMFPISIFIIWSFYYFIQLFF